MIAFIHLQFYGCSLQPGTKGFCADTCLARFHTAEAAALACFITFMLGQDVTIKMANVTEPVRMLDSFLRLHVYECRPV